jgi:hypothetical protein
VTRFIRKYGKSELHKQADGDSCEMLVAAELTLAGVPALKASDYWPDYDVAQPRDRKPQRISVKSRTFKQGAAFVSYSPEDVFDWLAIVILPGEDSSSRRIYVILRSFADKNARTYASEKTVNLREYRIDEVARKFWAYENNFTLADQSEPAELLHSEINPPPRRA